MKSPNTLLSAMLVLMFSACGSDPGGEAPAAMPDVPAKGDVVAAPQRVAEVDAARIIAADSEPFNWMSHGRSYDEQRFSPLAQIDESNVAQLGIDWSFDFPTRRGMEATPMVVDGAMYVTSTWSKVYAFDAASGSMLWHYDPEVPGAWAVHLCCDAVNRGVAVWQGKVFVGTLDGRLNALDADNGRRLWSVQTTPTEQALFDNRRTARGQGHGDHRQWRCGTRGTRFCQRRMTPTPAR